MTCSYQALARYDEMSYCGRARCTSDIRQRHREDIQSLRLETRHIQRLKIRHLYLGPDHQYEDEASESDQYNLGDYDTVDSVGSDQFDPTCWFTTGWGEQQQHPQCAPSPSLSNSSDLGSNSHCGSPAPSPRRSCRPIRNRRESLKIRKRIQTQFQDPESVRREYQDLRLLIERTSDIRMVTMIVSSRWTIISNAIKYGDQAVIHDALDMMTKLVSSQMIEVTDLLFVLQQGMIITLKDSLSRMGNHQVNVIKFLTTISQVHPAATPYLIETMSNTGFLYMFGELVSMGTSEEIHMVARFYSTIFEVLCDLAVDERFLPIIPTTIAATNSPQALAQLYNPQTILERIVQPHLLDPLVNWLFKQMGYIECASFRSTLNLTANCLNYITFHLQSAPSEVEWARSLVSQFESSQLDSLIERSIMDGTVKHYPDPVESEVRQFLVFYKQWSAEIHKSINSVDSET